MINLPNRHLPTENFKKNKDELSKSMNDANSIIKSFRRTLEEIRQFNRQAREYLESASKKLL